MNARIFGLVAIVIGICSVVYDLFPIYKSMSSRNWPTTTATISSIVDTGILFRLRRIIAFTYQVNGKSYNSTQMMPRDSWVQQLSNGSSIQVRYCYDKPQSALIEHSSPLGYLLLACWNCIWIIVGFCLVLKH